MKKIISYIRELFNWNYCYKCGWTKDKTYLYERINPEYPDMLCKKCIIKLKKK